MMNSNKLAHVVAVDRHESITAAANSLNVTQSTVSRSVADVESEIGYALFDRRARSVIATERGRQFLNRAARIISDLDQLSDDARHSRESGETLLRVGVSPASMQGLLNRAIKHLALSYRDVRVHLEAMSAEGGVRALRRGDIDILVGPEDAIRGQDSFVFENIGALNTQLFVRRAHPLAAAEAPKADDLTGYPLIAPDQLSWHAKRLRTLFEPLDEDGVRKMHMIEYFPLVAEIVAGSDAIGVVGTEYSETQSFSQRFSILKLAFFEPLPVGFAVRDRWHTTPAVRAFQATLREFPPGL